MSGLVSEKQWDHVRVCEGVNRQEVLMPLTLHLLQPVHKAGLKDSSSELSMQMSCSSAHVGTVSPLFNNLWTWRWHRSLDEDEDEDGFASKHVIKYEWWSHNMSCIHMAPTTHSVTIMLGCHWTQTAQSPWSHWNCTLFKCSKWNMYEVIQQPLDSHTLRPTRSSSGTERSSADQL